MVEIIAEVANAHQGCVDTALKLVHAAAEAGSNSVKFQFYTADELLVRTHPRYDHFKRQSFSVDQWTWLINEAKNSKLKVYADVFGEQSLSLAKKLDVDGVKIHSSDLGNVKLIKAMAGYQRNIFVAVGGSSVFEILKAIDNVSYYCDGSNIIIMHGYQCYPTEVKDSNIFRLHALRNLLGERFEYGYMDHIDADKPEAIVVPLLTIGMGVKYIEKHITIDRSAKGVDYFSSLESEEFKNFVELAASCSSALGDVSFDRSVAETEYRNNVKKTWVAKREMTAPHTIIEDDIIMKRVLSERESLQYEELVGKTLTRDIGFEKEFTRQYFDNKVLAVILVRTSSTRLDGKALLKINGESTISHLINRLLLAKKLGYVDAIAVCTSDHSSDDQLCAEVSKYPVDLFRGDQLDVLGRMTLALDAHPSCNTILRITGDDILVDPEYIGKTVNYHHDYNLDYTSAKRLIGGTEVEVFSDRTIRDLAKLAKDRSGTEYLTWYVTDNKSQFRVGDLPVSINEAIDDITLTIDEHHQYIQVKNLLEFFAAQGKKYSYSMQDIMAWVRKNKSTVLKKEPMDSTIENRVDPRMMVVTDLEWKKLYG